MTFSNNGSFSPHIENIWNKALRVLGYINRVFSSLGPSTYKVLYYTLFRSILEYASPIWSPFTCADSTKLKLVQRRFLRSLAFLNSSPMGLDEHDYSHIESRFDVHKLENRWKVTNVIFLYILYSERFYQLS